MKSLSCLLGIHTWYSDSAWFLSSKKCVNCEADEDTLSSFAVSFERGLWDDHLIADFDERKELVRSELVRRGLL